MAETAQELTKVEASDYEQLDRLVQSVLASPKTKIKPQSAGRLDTILGVEALRQFYGMTAGDFADAIGITGSIYSRIKNGKAELDERFLDAVIEATGVARDWLTSEKVLPELDLTSRLFLIEPQHYHKLEMHVQDVQADSENGIEVTRPNDRERVERLEALRLFYGLTAGQFAGKLLMHSSVYSGIKTGRIHFSMERINQVVDATGIDKGWLHDGAVQPVLRKIQDDDYPLLDRYVQGVLRDPLNYIQSDSHLHRSVMIGLEAIRLFFGLTADKFSKAIGARPSTYSNMKSGKFRSSGEYIERIIEQTGVDREWLFAEKKLIGERRASFDVDAAEKDYEKEEETGSAADLPDAHIDPSTIQQPGDIYSRKDVPHRGRPSFAAEQARRNRATHIRR